LPYLLQLKDVDYEQIEEVKAKLQKTKNQFEKSINEFGTKAKKIVKESGADEGAFYQKNNGILGYFTTD
jgi:hypothetical protein